MLLRPAEDRNGSNPEEHERPALTNMLEMMRLDFAWASQQTFPLFRTPNLQIDVYNQAIAVLALVHSTATVE